LVLDGGKQSVSLSVAVPAWKKPLVSTEKEAGWTPEPTWRLWRRGKCFASARN